MGILWGEMNVTQPVSAPLGKACLQPELRESPVTQASRRKSPFAFGNPSLPLSLLPDESVAGTKLSTNLFIRRGSQQWVEVRKVCLGGDLRAVLAQFSYFRA